MIITSIIEWLTLADARRKLDPSEGECLLYTSRDLAQARAEMRYLRQSVNTTRTIFSVVGALETFAWLALWVNW